MPTTPDSPSRRTARKDTAAATAILVLGMHRSGTSAVARMLNLCGAELGRDLLPPKQDNERGFWENSALLALHERFLGETGLQWYDLASLPGNWRDGAAARRFVAALPELLSRQFGDSRLFLVKDPRLSLLAPLWIEVLERRAVRPVFVITIRHPDEVAASLAKRDGFSYARSHLLWLQHLLEAEQATRGHSRVFVHYERVLTDWRAELGRIAAALELTWPNSGAETDKQISAFITPSLRHHGNDAREPAAPMPAIVQEAYAIASSAAGSAGNGSALSSAFDAVASAFEHALQLAGPLIGDLSDQLARGSQSHAREIERARATIDDFAAQIGQAREAHESRDRLESELRGQLASSVGEVGRARDNIDALAAELDLAREGFAAKEREIDAARENVNAIATDLARAVEVIALKDREIDAARRNIDGLIEELAQARAAITAKEREIDAARATIGALAGEMDQARVLIDARVVELDAARANIDALAAQVEHARADFAAKDAEIGRARAGFAAKEAELDGARGNIDALVAEIERARGSIAAKDAELDAARGSIAAKDAELDVARRSIEAKDAELDAARGNIDALVAEIDGAREAHAARDATESALRTELAALRGSRWFRVGRKLGLIDRNRR